jgi:hypothetical protein
VSLPFIFQANGDVLKSSGKLALVGVIPFGIFVEVAFESHCVIFVLPQSAAIVYWHIWNWWGFAVVGGMCVGRVEG